MTIVECEVCGSWTIVSELPRNNICNVCLYQGGLFIQTEQNYIKKKALMQSENNERKTNV